MIRRCSVCGSACEHYTADEGTQSMSPLKLPAGTLITRCASETEEYTAAVFDGQDWRNLHPIFASFDDAMISLQRYHGERPSVERPCSSCGKMVKTTVGNQSRLICQNCHQSPTSGK